MAMSHMNIEKLNLNLYESVHHKKYIKLDFYVNSAFKVATGQQSVIMNYITPIDAGLPGSCNVTKPLYAKKFSRNGFDIIMEAGPMECALLDEIDEESLETYLIDIYVKEYNEYFLGSP